VVANIVAVILGWVMIPKSEEVVAG
jgi:hypothetical protein